MELFRELFLTASVALVLSFLVAKIIAMTMVSDVPNQESEFRSSKNGDDGVVLHELQSKEKLRVQASESEKRIEFFDEVVKVVDHLEDKEANRVKEKVSVEEPQRYQEEVLGESCESSGKVLVEESDGSELPEKQSDGEAKILVKNTCKTSSLGVNEVLVDEYVDSLKNRGSDEITVQSMKDESVTSQAEEVRIVGDEMERYEVNVVEMRDEIEIDEDDWEGVEKNELENDFVAAVKFVEVSANDCDRSARLGDDVQTDLFGLHKVAIEGPFHEAKPSLFEPSARDKWIAWQKLGNMSQDMAMELYVKTLSDNVPGWMEDNLFGTSKQEFTDGVMLNTGAPVSSTFPPQESDLTRERILELKSGTEEGDLTGNQT